MATTRVIGLGAARIETPVGVIDPTAPAVFAAALFLALERHRQVSRDEISSLLWPVIPKPSRNHRFRQLALRLRKFGFPVESVDSRQLHIPSDQIVIDIEELLDGGLASTAADVYWMRGYVPQISDQYSEWFDDTQARFHASIARVLLPTISDAQQRGSWEDVESRSRRLLEISPLNEAATLALAEAVSMRGERAVATNILTDFEERVGAAQDLTSQVTAMRRRVHQIDKRHRNSGRPLPLIGRGAVLKSLHKSLDAARNGGGQSCFLLGAAGIGKSRVLVEASELARLQGFSVIQIQCRDGHQRIPLAASVQLAEMVRPLPGALGCAPETFALLDRLTRHDPRESPDAGFSADSAWVFFSVRRAIFDALDAVADEQPLLIAIEDSHWLDNASATLITDVISWAKSKRISIVLTGRDMPNEWRVTNPQPLEIVHVRPLDETDARELLAALLPDSKAPMSHGYASWCVKVAEGNPYYLTELANHWIETGIDHGVPPSLSEVLSDRIRRLPQEALQLLQAISLLENDSTLERIEAVLQSPTHELLRSIEHLVGADMIATPAAASEIVSAKHDLLSLAALECLSPSARRLLHRSIARVLEDEVGALFHASTVWSGARHWQKAGDQRRALRLARACADHLLKVGLLPDAAKAYTDGMTFCDTDEQRLEMCSGQLASYYHMSDWNKVKAIAATVASLRVRSAQSPIAHDDHELMALRAEWHDVEWEAILKRSLGCLDAEDASPSHKAEAGVMSLIAMSYVSQSKIHAVFDRLGNLFADPSVNASTKYFATMVYHACAGDMNQAVDAARLLLNEELKNNDLGTLFRAYCNAGVTFRVSGLFEESETAFRSALAITETHHLALARARVLSLMGSLALEIGNFDLARECEHGLRAVEAIEPQKIDVWDVKALRMRLALIDGRLDDARMNIPAPIETVLTESSFHTRTYNLALHAALHLCAAESIPQQLFDAFRESFENSKHSLHQAFAACTLAKVFERNGNASEGTKLLAEYEKSIRREPWPIPGHLRNLFA